MTAREGLPLMVLHRELNLAEGEMLLVNKPRGWTSFDVVNKIRSLFHVRKIGHAGTLDPLATGLLIVCTGKKTREIDLYQGREKEYDATILLGARTASFDAETPVIEWKSTDGITADNVRKVLLGFVGYQTQLPPMWSAAKVRGTRLYKYAKKGIEVERRPREILISSIEPTLIDLPQVRFTVVCSKGTYIRTLADDVGRTLGCGAYLESLTRTRIGEYRLADALSIDELVQYKADQRKQAI
jgi:tRNA pseudouridine55 synthase